MYKETLMFSPIILLHQHYCYCHYWCFVVTADFSNTIGRVGKKTKSDCPWQGNLPLGQLHCSENASLVAQGAGESISHRSLVGGNLQTKDY